MRKLSKIDESSWGEMRKRSSGEVIRKENDVNIFDAYGLYDYIKQNYSIKTQTTITRLVGNGGSIYIALYEDTDGYDTILMYDNIDGDRRLYISGGFKETGEYIYNEMCSEYTLTEMNDEDPDGHPLGNIRVEPKGCRYENLTNSFFLEVLDFIIERVEKPLEQQIEKKSINESTWGDMRKRSSGEQIRKEDNINMLEFEEFVKYLQETYEVLIQPNFFAIGFWYIGGGDGIGRISIPIEKNNGNDTPNLSNRMLMIEKDIQKDEYLSISPNNYTFRLYPNELRKTFGDKYYVDGSDLKLIPKDGSEITNQVCVDVIDRLLGMVENPILKKKI